MSPRLHVICLFLSGEEPERLLTLMFFFSLSVNSILRLRRDNSRTEKFVPISFYAGKKKP